MSQILNRGVSVGIVSGIAIFIRALLGNRAAIAAENLALRQQLVVLRRSARRPRLRRRDGILWVWLSRLWLDWRSSLMIVNPETVIRWRREGFRLYWRWKSRGKPGHSSADDKHYFASSPGVGPCKPEGSGCPLWTRMRVPSGSRGGRGSFVVVMAYPANANRPRSVFVNSASLPLAAISRSIAATCTWPTQQWLFSGRPTAAIGGVRPDCVDYEGRRADAGSVKWDSLQPS